MVKDIGLIVIGEGSADFRPTWRVGPILCPVIAAKLGLFIFFQFIRVIISCKSLCGLVARQLAPEISPRLIFCGVAFLFSIDYGIAVTALGQRLLKGITIYFHIDAFLLALLPDIPEKLCEGYIVTFNLNLIIRHDAGLLKDMFHFCE